MLLHASYAEGPTVKHADDTDVFILLLSYSGCGTVSAFAGKGKMRAVNLLMRSQHFTSIFSALGEDWGTAKELVDNICTFVCSVYKPLDNVDLLRYHIYCSKGGKVEPEALPPM